MTKLKLRNTADLVRVRDGHLRPEQVRELEIDALVDTGATMLVLPADVVAVLGLRERERVGASLADGSVRLVPIVDEFEIEILGRRMTCDALVMPAGSTPLIGQIPLERLDLVVNPKSREVTVNPLSPDTPRVDALRVA
jgi:clan AA aspartic protease